jgi:hypothetical protein
MKRLDISEATPISMPIKNMIGIVSACLVGAYFAFSTIERLNIVETEIQLMKSDLVKAATQTPVDQEQYILLEFISDEHSKLRETVQDKLPMIDKIDMHTQFLEERVIDLETLTDKLRGNGHD